VIAASTAARREVVGSQQAPALETEPETLKALLDATLARLNAAAVEPRAVITLGDPRYPRTLLDAPDPPLLIYAQGRIELPQADAIAIVGSRNPTPQGADNARAFASHLSHAGLTVVSGLALGVDAAAHAGGLEGAASTIAVFGTGLDIVYPRRNLSLAHRIADNGLILSECALGTPSMPQNFAQRNRIIAGLAGGTLVVEAALKSGSLITARLANEAGREVVAVPARFTRRSRTAATRGSGRARNWSRPHRTSSKSCACRAPRRIRRPPHRAPIRPTHPCSRRSASTRSRSTPSPRAPAGTLPSSARGCSASNSTAGSRGCRASCFSAWHEAEARRPARRLRRETGYP
jgi:DNA protecting protein DprA